ncbi:MAG: aminotransferase class IV, partial [Burkholderiales bacterium]
MTTPTSGSVEVLETRKQRAESDESAAPDIGAQIYVNGEILPRHEASVSVFDHGLLYGDGVFEGIRIYPVAGQDACRIFRLEAHLDRLYRSAARVEIDLPGKLSLPRFKEVLLDTIRANRDGVMNPDPGQAFNYIRPLVTRGAGDLGINPKKCK